MSNETATEEPTPGEVEREAERLWGEYVRGGAPETSQLIGLMFASHVESVKQEYREKARASLRKPSSPSGASGTEEENDLTAESLSVQLDDMASECESSAAQSRGLREGESQINAYLDDALFFRKTAMYLRSYVSLLAEASAPAGEEPAEHWRDDPKVKRCYVNLMLAEGPGSTADRVDALCDAVAALHSRSHD